MTDDTLDALTISLGAVASALKEHQRHRVQHTPPPTEYLAAMLLRESARLRLNDQPNLADGLLSLRDQLGVNDNA